MRNRLISLVPHDLPTMTPLFIVCVSPGSDVVIYSVVVLALCMPVHLPFGECQLTRPFIFAHSALYRLLREGFSFPLF